MKYLAPKFNSRPASKEYRDNYDRVFPRVISASRTGSVTLDAPITHAQWSPKPRRAKKR